MDKKRRDEPNPKEREPQRREDELPVQKVTSVPKGAKRDGFFKRRDYNEE